MICAFRLNSFYFKNLFEQRNLISAKVINSKATDNSFNTTFNSLKAKINDSIHRSNELVNEE